MKTLTLLISIACLMISKPHARADSVFAGVFLSGHGDGIAAGKIAFTANAAQVSFQATLFQQFVTNGPLQVALEIEGKTTPISLGEGIPGTWPVGDFLGPAPGTVPAPPPNPFPDLERMPSLPLPNAQGTRFTGSFDTFPGFEHLMLARGGTAYLQIPGTVASLQNPIFKAILINVTIPPPFQFTATLSGTNEIPPNGSPFHGAATFTLSGSNLAYTLTMDPGFVWTSAAICDSAAPHPNSHRVIASLTTSLGATTPGGQAVYSGTLPLNDEQVDQLKRGKFYVNFLTAQYPNGEIGGQALPVLPAKASREDRR